MVRVAGFAPSVIVAGLKVAVAPAGRPVAVKTIGGLNAPATGATVKLNVVEAPGTTAGDVAAITGVRVKSLFPTASETVFEVLAVKFESPVYWAVMAEVPMGRAAVVSVAVPAESATEANGDEPLKNWIEPVGVPVVAVAAVAVRVIGAARFGVGLEVVRAVLVPA